MNLQFQDMSAISKVKLTPSISLFKMQLLTRKSDIKIEDLFRMCSSATNLVTSPCFPFEFVVSLFCAVLAYCGTVFHSPTSFNSTALLQTMVQANTEPFWNTLVKTRNQLVKKKNQIGTHLFPVQIVSK